MGSRSTFRFASKSLSGFTKGTGRYAIPRGSLHLRPTFRMHFFRTWRECIRKPFGVSLIGDRLRVRVQFIARRRAGISGCIQSGCVDPAIRVRNRCFRTSRVGEPAVETISASESRAGEGRCVTCGSVTVLFPVRRSSSRCGFGPAGELVRLEPGLESGGRRRWHGCWTSGR